MTTKILVAEDNHINQKIITSILGAFSYDYDLVENGGKALEAVRERTYDLVLMDLEMPEMDGVEATLWIRDQVSKEIPIIAVTANADRWSESDIFKAGMNGMVAKPLNAQLLVEAIDSQLNGTPILVPPQEVEAEEPVVEENLEEDFDEADWGLTPEDDVDAMPEAAAPEVAASEGFSGDDIQQAMGHLDAIAQVTDDAGDTIVGALEKIEASVAELQDDNSEKDFYDVCADIEEYVMDAMQACGFTDLVAQKIKVARESIDPDAADGQEGGGAGFSQGDIDSLFD